MDAQSKNCRIRSVIRWIAFIALVTMVPLLLPWKAVAGVFEISGGFSFNKTTYSDQSYTWTRRWSGSVAYYLTELSSIELTFQDAITRNSIIGLEDTTFHDRVYSVNWVQHFTGRDFPVQPYLKAGVGQLNRDERGTYASGGSPPAQDDTLTAILGAGLKIYLTKTFGLRGEFTTYLDGARIATWKDNCSAIGGISVFF